MNESLKTNFVGKTIVEFPQLYVVIKGFYGATPVDEISSSSGKINPHSLLTTKDDNSERVNVKVDVKPDSDSDSSDCWDSTTESKMDIDLQLLKNIEQLTGKT